MFSRLEQAAIRDAIEAAKQIPGLRVDIVNLQNAIRALTARLAELEPESKRKPKAA